MLMLWVILNAHADSPLVDLSALDLGDRERGACPTVAIRDAMEDGRLSPPARPDRRAVAPSDAVTVDTEHFHLEGMDYEATEEELQTLGDIFEFVWSAEIDEHGWNQPRGTDAGKMDIYLAALEEWHLGYTSKYDDGSPYIVLNADMSFTDQTTEDAWRVTAAHEFHHGVQFTYDNNAAGWWMESTATWMEDEVYDDIDDYFTYLRSTQWPAYPEISLVASNGWHEYGSVLWNKYLSENYGGHDAIQAIWEGCVEENAKDATTAYLAEQGVAYDDAFMDFSARNATMQGYEEAAGYGEVRRLESVSTYPAEGSPADSRPDYLGANYLYFEPTSKPMVLNLSFEGETEFDGDPVEWGVLVSACDETGCTWEPMALSDGVGTYALHDFGGTWTSAWLIPTVLSETGLRHDAYGTSGSQQPPTYSWSASLSEPADPDTGEGLDDDEKATGQGCACASAPRSSPAGLLALGLLGLLARRRR